MGSGVIAYPLALMAGQSVDSRRSLARLSSLARRRKFTRDFAVPRAKDGERAKECSAS
jgi:hypothetical protein